MKNYVIAWGDRFRDVEDEVNELISKGYYPVGPLQISTTSCIENEDYTYEQKIAQTMLLEKEHQKEIDIKWEKEIK